MMTEDLKMELKERIRTIVPIWTLFVLIGATFRHLIIYGYAENIASFIWKYQIISLVAVIPIIGTIIYWFVERKMEIHAQWMEYRAVLTTALLALIGGYVAGYWIHSCFVAGGVSPLTIAGIVLTLIVSLSSTLVLNKRFLLKESGGRVGRQSQEAIFEPDQTKEDEFDTQIDAKHFAECVLRGGVSEPLIFGIDSPWGSGKTTYLSYCKKIWTAPNNNCLVAEFSALSGGEDDLVGSFIRYVERFLVDQRYPRDIRIAFEKYTKFISGAKLGWFDLGAVFGQKLSNEDILKSLSKKLDRYGKKLIIIVDDLDRASADQVKRLLDVVRVGSELPMVTFVICFDAMNILSFENPSRKATRHEPKNLAIEQVEYDFSDRTKTLEYLEKMVNVKQTLVFHPEKLRDFLAKRLLDDSGMAVFADKSKVEIAAAVDRIFNPVIYHHLVPQIGDPRKLKRLVNIFRLRFGRLDIDISQIDISAYDLLLLMMIYLNHPALFKKIYDTEVHGKEFFSLVYNRGLGRDKDDKKTFINSPDYERYLTSLDEPQRILLQEIFSAERANNNDASQAKIGRDAAAFNGTISSGRNLEGYLKLITKRQLPSAPNEAKFYEFRTRILSEGSTIAEIVKESEFVFTAHDNVERRYKLLIEAIVRSIADFRSTQIIDIVNWMVENITDFSSVTSDDLGIGLRNDITLQIPYLLNLRGWSDKSGDTWENSEENIVQIADRLLGDRGVFDLLLTPDKSVIRFHDALKLRLHLSPYRGGNFDNLYRGMKYRLQKITNNQSEPSDKEQMLEPTVKIFTVFRNRYIDKNRNFIKEIYELTDEQLLGKSLLYLRSSGLLERLDLYTQRVSQASFVIYQLINNRVDQLNFGCGLYPDPQDHTMTIQQSMRRYLFEVAFNVKRDKNAATYFIDYLLMHYDRSPMSRNSNFQLDIGEITALLGEKELATFWIENGVEIRREMQGKKRTMNTGNYKITYEALPDLYMLLDILAVAELERLTNIDKLVMTLRRAVIQMQRPMVSDEIAK